MHAMLFVVPGRHRKMSLQTAARRRFAPAFWISLIMLGAALATAGCASRHGNAALFLPEQDSITMKF